MEKDKSIDFDCEFYLQRVANEGSLENRRTTNSVIYHLCTYAESDKKRRCDMNSCPRKKN